MKLLITACLVLLATSPWARALPLDNATIEREEYAVYAAIIPETYHQNEGGILLIANPTWRYANQITKKDFYFIYPAPVLSQDTLNDFLERNKTNRWLERRFQLEFAYVLVDLRAIEKLIGKSPLSDWQDFFRQFPASHGFAGYSRVGFNQKMDQALVSRSWACPYLCGESEFLLLKKKDEVWHVVNRANRTVS